MSFFIVTISYSKSHVLILCHCCVFSFFLCRDTSLSSELYNFPFFLNFALYCRFVFLLFISLHPIVTLFFNYSFNYSCKNLHPIHWWWDKQPLSTVNICSHWNVHRHTWLHCTHGGVEWLNANILYHKKVNRLNIGPYPKPQRKKKQTIRVIDLTVTNRTEVLLQLYSIVWFNYSTFLYLR